MTPHPDAGIEAEYNFRLNSCPKHNLLGAVIEALTVYCRSAPGIALERVFLSLRQLRGPACLSSAQCGSQRLAKGRTAR